MKTITVTKREGVGWYGARHDAFNAISDVRRKETP